MDLFLEKHDECIMTAIDEMAEIEHVKNSAILVGLIILPDMASKISVV